jgi:hypothetical protein
MFSAATILHPTDFCLSAEQAFWLAETLTGSRHAHLPPRTLDNSPTYLLRSSEDHGGDHRD